MPVWYERQGKLERRDGKKVAEGTEDGNGEKRKDLLPTPATARAGGVEIGRKGNPGGEKNSQEERKSLREREKKETELFSISFFGQGMINKRCYIR